MATKTIKYIGTAPLPEEPITGSKRVWDYGQTQSVDSVVATQLLTTGLFEDDAGMPVSAKTNPLTGESIISAGGVDIPIANSSLNFASLSTRINMWLAADSGVTVVNGKVTEWADKPGNALSAVQAIEAAQPVLTTNPANNLPAVQFSGAGTYMKHGYSKLIGSAFVVFSHMTDSNSNQGLLSADAGTAGLAAYYLKAGGSSPAGRSFISSKSSTTSDSAFIQRIYSVPQVLSGINTGAALKLYDGNLEVASTPITGFPRLTGGTKGNTIGCGIYDGNYGDFLNGYIHEVIIFDSALSASEQAVVANYLSQKYNMPVSAGKYSFYGFRSGGSPGGGGVGTDQSLYLLQGNDGSNWWRMPIAYKPNGTALVRDPSVVKIGNIWWMAHTRTAITGNSFDIAKSTDGRAFTYVTTVDCSAFAGASGGNCWAPEWFIDTDNTVHIIVSLTTTNGSLLKLYEVNPTDLTGLTTWSVPVLLGGTGWPTSYIDGQVTKVGATYFLWYKDQAGYTCYASSSSLLTGYTQVKTGLWNANLIMGKEGMFMIPMGGSRWRLYLDPGGTAPGYVYHDSFDNWATWSVAQTLTAPFQIQHGSVLVN